MNYDYQYMTTPQTFGEQGMINVQDQRFRPGFGWGRPGFGFGRPGFGWGRPGFGFGFPGFGLGLGFLGGLATGALLAPGPGFGYPVYPYPYPVYPYPYF